MNPTSQNPPDEGGEVASRGETRPASAMPASRRPGTPLRTRLFLLVLLSSLTPAALVLLAGWLQQRHQVRLWTIPSVESALDASLETNRRAFERLRRHLEAEGRILAESHALALVPADTTGLGDLLQAGCRQFGIDLAQFYVWDDPRFTLLASRTPEGRGGPEAGAEIPSPSHGTTGPSTPVTLRLRSSEGDILAVPTYLFSSPDGAGPTLSGVLLLGVRLGPNYYDRLQEVSSGLSFYRRLQEVGRVLRTGYGLLAGVLLLASIAVALYIARRVARAVSEPVDDLIRQMEEVGRGSERAAPDPESQIPEMAQLSRAFRSMRETLRVYETRLRETERIRGTQETARFVAHEIRNTLTPIRASLSVLQRQVAALEGERRDRGDRALDLIRKETDRMASLAGAFSEYSAFPDRRPVRVDPGELAEEIARQEVPDRIKIRLSHQPDLSAVAADRDELERALRNLIRNGVEAISGEGEISVDLRNGPGGGTIEITVSDSGCGMDEATLEKALQPGFTTKATGTGLGLPLVRRSVSHYGGSVSVQSQPGRGTVVRITLPATDPEDDGRKGTRHGQANPDR